MPNNDDQLAQQYQDILNKYASSLSPQVDTPPVETPVVTPPEQIVTPPEPIAQLSDLQPAPLSNPIKPEPLVVTPLPNPIVGSINLETEPVITEPVITQPVISEPVKSESSVLFTASNPDINKPFEKPFETPSVPPIYFPPEPVNPPSSSNFFKYLFFLSLLVFIGVVVAIVFSLTSQTTETPIVEKPVSTPTPTKFCEVGDKKYEVGESFPSEDGCNTCSCGSDLMIACTLMACGEPESVLGASTSNVAVKKVPTKVYKDAKYGYQFECPTTAKYLVEATSVNGNKIPFKQESCTIDESITTISIYDNTIVHSFGDLKTMISADKKYIVTLEGDNSEILSSFKFLK